MKKIIIRITIFVMMFFVIFSVKAAEAYTQSEVNSNYEKYKNAISELKNLNCDGELLTQAAVDKCNNLGLQKSISLAYLFNARKYDKKLISSEIQSVLDSNKENCSSAISSNIQEFLNKVFLMFYIAGPILLIVFGSLDLTQAIVAGDEKKRKELYTKFIKRTIALALLFVSPVLVGLLLNIMGASKYSSTAYTCNYTQKELTIKYSPVAKKSVVKNTGLYGGLIGDGATGGTGNSNGGSGGTNIDGNADTATRIVQAAKSIYDVAQSAGWKYACKSNLSTLENAYNNKKFTRLCCAEYVAFVLYKAGVFSKSDINNITSTIKKSCGDWRTMHEATGIQSFLIAKGWIKITNYKDLKAGDIVFNNTKTYSIPNKKCYPDGKRAGHVEVYMGNNLTYSAGGGNGINPFAVKNKYKNGKNFLVAYRAP